jgi:hypothetical protein
MLVKLSRELLRFDSITEANAQDDPVALLAAAEANLKTLEAIVKEARVTHRKYFLQVLSMRELINNLKEIG